MTNNTESEQWLEKTILAKEFETSHKIHQLKIELEAYKQATRELWLERRAHLTQGNHDY